MKGLNKEVLMWMVVIVGKLLLALTVYNLNNISNNLEKINDNVQSLTRLTDKLDIRLRYMEIKVDKQELDIEGIKKEFYNEQIKRNAK